MTGALRLFADIVHLTHLFEWQGTSLSAARQRQRGYIGAGLELVAITQKGAVCLAQAQTDWVRASIECLCDVILQSDQLQEQPGALDDDVAMKRVVTEGPIAGAIISGKPLLFVIQTVDVGGQRLRVGVRPGVPGRAPLLLFNGIGANLELLEPLAAALAGVEMIIFDVPGVGGSPTSRWPYRFSGLARLANRLLSTLGYEGPVDVLGVSWGGAVAQQFAFQYPQRCRRLILAATSPGALMVPGRLSAITKLASPRRYLDPQYFHRVGAELYGGDFRHQPELLREHGQHMRSPRGLGYFYQMLAGVGWTSLPWLPWLRQRTLVLAGSDDPIVPVINAKILAQLIRRSKLHVVDDGHLFLVTRALEIAPVIRQFLCDDSGDSD